MWIKCISPKEDPLHVPMFQYPLSRFTIDLRCEVVLLRAESLGNGLISCSAGSAKLGSAQPTLGYPREHRDWRVIKIAALTAHKIIGIKPSVKIHTRLEVLSDIRDEARPIAIVAQDFGDGVIIVVKRLPAWL